MSQLSARQLSIAYSGRTVLEGLDLTAGDGERLGLVGENGSGKSTLLRLLAGTEQPDSGVIDVRGSVGHLGQEPELPAGTTIGDAVDAALAELRTLERRMRSLEHSLADGDDVLAEYGDVLAEFEARDGWVADVRAARALSGLGLGELSPTRVVGELSGGQRARLALALMLVRSPEILLLDEPTNHLDDDALAFLEASLREHRGIVIVAAHDRAFLDAVCTSILDLDPTLTVGADDVPVIGPARYTGAYTDYLAGKAAARTRWRQAHDAWNAAADAARAAVRTDARRIGHTNRAPRDNDKFAPRFFAAKVDTAVARRVRDAEARVARLEQRRVPKPPRPLRLAAPAAAAAAQDRVLVAVRDAVVPGRVAIPGLDLTPGTRLLVTGENGSGKSSLLALLAGALPPSTGRLLHARGLTIGWLPQHGTYPDPAATALEVFAAGRPGPPEDHEPSLLALGLLAARDLRTPVGRLSYGQQRRLALARLMTAGAQLLLLDEPTNHLSLTLVEELEEAITTGTQAVVVVSHDRWLRRRWAGEQAVVADGTVTRPVGDSA